MNQRIVKILNRLCAIVLIVSIWTTAIGSMFEYAMATTAYSQLGSNAALGSPILNPNFSADDWNKWEMITWGIFLSNFTTPFVDDYNSAFNQDAGYGSKGSGAKALQFGSGQDVANNDTIQDLLDYAINQQSQGAIKQIYVSYSKMDNYTKPNAPSFTSSVTDSGASDATTDNTEGIDPDDVAGGATEEQLGTGSIRAATVADLFFNITSDGTDGTTWVDAHKDSENWTDKKVKIDNYAVMVGSKSGNIPMFAIRTSSNAYERILDYTDSYDLNVMTLVITHALAGDYASEFAANLDKMLENPSQFPLVLDCFGNICTMVDGTYRVIVPGAANKWLTTNPSINLANSLVFNACTKTTTEEMLISNGGQAKSSLWHIITNIQNMDAGGRLSGMPAFENGTDGLNPGQAVIIFDTDTIVYQHVSKDAEMNLGEVYRELFDADINQLLTCDYTFKVEPVNLTQGFIEKIFGGKEGKAKTQSLNMLVAASQLSNQFNSKPTAEVLTKLKTDTKQDLEIFGDPVIVAVQQEDSLKKALMDSFSKAKYNKVTLVRRLINYAYQAYKFGIADSTTGTVTRESISNALDNTKSFTDFLDNITLNPEKNMLSELSKSFIHRFSEFYKVTDIAKLKNGAVGDSKWTVITKGETGLGFSINKSNVVDANTGDDIHKTGARLVKAYQTSDVMTSIANVLGVREGTEFALYSMYIYMTYLDWYGVTGTSLTSLNGSNNTSKLNSAIFDDNSDVLKVDINSLTTLVSDEQKEKDIMNWTYLLLNPTEGREYRSNIIISGIADWIYDQYQKITYGNASSYYVSGTGVTSHNTTGFMTVSPYSENFLTAWLVNNYSYFASIALGIFIILIIVSGLLQKRKFSWFFVTIVVTINMILILPATGEVAPLISNNFVQNMFSDKMSYWAISESVTNATMESDYVTNSTISRGFLGRLTKDEQSQVISMVKNLNTLYLDRSLSIRQDISKKVTAASYGNFEELQNLRSARWMLPMIMRQFTANDGSANYVYTPLGDKQDDLSNLYWFFDPDDAAYVNTVNAKQTSSNGELPNYQGDAKSNITNYFSLWKDTSAGYDSDSWPYKAVCYGDPDREVKTNLVHRYNYMLTLADITGDEGPATGVLSGISDDLYNPSNYSSYDEWAKAYATALQTDDRVSNLDTIERHIEVSADQYSRFDRETMVGLYAYLWATENPYHYFYALVKDCFLNDSSLGNLIGELQGSYAKAVDEFGNDTEVRKSFMHTNDTGYVRDVADLEELFTNVIPYLYSMQLLANGYDGEDAFEGEMIQDLAYYKDINPKAWLFRSNWVTKIMENKELHAKGTVSDSEGNKYEVANMLIPSCYPENRPMIFSEAQMRKENLQEYDLNLVELKCVKINNDIMKEWTLLINYASVKGMTKEVMLRQMAFDALVLFNSEFTPVGLLNGAYTMYPNGLDLRTISFDSVMKMLMLNVTHDTSYIYGDTMQTLVEDADIFTAIMLLITAVSGVWLIPLARKIVMAAIFFMGIWSILWSIMKTTSTKAKISCGYIISNLVFTGITFCYYLLFDALMAMTTSDEVLTISQIEVNTGNPVWCMIFILAISIVYVIALYKLLVMCAKNIRDMGFEVYKGIAEMAAGKISNGIEAIGEKIAGANFGYGVGDHSRKPTTGRTSQEPVAVMDVSRSGTSSSAGRRAIGDSATSSPEGSEYEQDKDYESSGYTDTRYSDGDGGGRTSDIDSEINKGKEIAKQEKEKGHSSDRSTEPKSTQS